MKSIFPVALAALLLGCGSVLAADEGAPALTVGLVEVAARPMARTVSGTGSVVAWQELVIGAEASGLRVVELPVEEGDTVRRGQLLARLDDSVLSAQLAQNAAAIAEAEANSRTAQSELRRAQELTRTGTSAQQNYEQRLGAARAAEARVASIRAQRGEIEARLAQTRILAATDGIVSRRAASLGSVVTPGLEIARLIRDGRIELDAQVPELDLAAVKPGQAVRVHHGERVVEAEVRAVAPVVAPDTRQGVVHVRLPESAGLKPGMFARAEIRVAEQVVPAIPQEAVVYRDGRPAAFVMASGERVALRLLGLGGRRDGWVEVTGGLAAGDKVVVTGAGFLNDGDRVRVGR